MKITDLQAICYLDDTDLIEFKECHPKQIISQELSVPIWKIIYSYKTKRNNLKTAIKYMIKAESDWDCIDNEFNIYINRFNDENPERKISNVEILDTAFIGKVYLELD